MSVSMRRIGESMGAEVTGLDLRDDSSPETIAMLNDALHEHIVLCIRDQHFTPAQFLAAAKLFGEPVHQVNKHLDVTGFDEVGVISSEVTDVHGDGKRHPQGTTWHTDHSFTAKPPKATILYAITVPETGGDTSFCNTRAAYAALPDATRRRVDELQAVHRYESSRSPRKVLVRTSSEVEATPEVVHPLARTYPPTGEKALFLSTTRLDRIVEMDRAESDALIDDLMTYADRPEFHYHHQWRVGDMVIWDNRCSLHHANADYGDQARLLHRVMIEGEVPV